MSRRTAASPGPPILARSSKSPGGSRSWTAPALRGAGVQAGRKLEVYFASPADSSYVTGEVLTLLGGETVGVGLGVSDPVPTITRGRNRGPSWEGEFVLARLGIVANVISIRLSSSSSRSIRRRR